MLRTVLAVVAAGALAGVLTAVLDTAGYHAGWIAGACVTAAVILLNFAEHRLSPPAKAPPNPDRLHWAFGARRGNEPWCFACGFGPN